MVEMPMANDSNQVSQAGGHPPAAEPKPKKRLWLKIAAGLAVVIVLAVVIGFWATSGLVDTIDRQLAAIKRGDMQAAYAENAIALRDRISLADFETFVKRYPALHRNADRSFNSRSFQGGSGEVKGTLTDDRGAVMPVQYRLVKENDVWRILSIRLGDKTD
jgi:hypothetical protein